MSGSRFFLVLSLFVLCRPTSASIRHNDRARPTSASPRSTSVTPFTPFTKPCAASACFVRSTDVAPTWTIDVSQRVHAVSPDLYGIFFEEYSYSGEGGLYQQQIQNINFETTLSSYAPWEPLNSDLEYVMQLDTMRPLNAYNPTSLLVTTQGTAGQQAGVINPGFWGISLINRTSFDLSFHAYSATIKQVVAALTSADGKTVYGSITFFNVGPAWTALRGQIKVASADPSARFQLTYQTTAKTDRIAFDVVVLMPSTGWNGLQFIRPDLGQLLADMRPSFVRFPGGCYLEGDRLANRFNWKRALGPLEERTGHWNFWGQIAHACTPSRDSRQQIPLLARPSLLLTRFLSSLCARRLLFARWTGTLRVLQLVLSCSHTRIVQRSNAVCANGC